jgi:hypothetical protein
MSLENLALFLNKKYNFISEEDVKNGVIATLIASFNTSEQPKSSGLCTSILRSGKNKGSQCGCKESKKGSSKCKKHEKTTVAKEVSSESEEEPKKKIVAGKLGKKGLDVKVHENLLNLVNQRKTNVILNKNQHGNYVHHGTNLVFDKETSSVKGKQLLNGTLADLTESDIQLCITNNWVFTKQTSTPVSTSVGKPPLGDRRGETVPHDDSSSDSELYEDTETDAE